MKSMKSEASEKLRSLTESLRELNAKQRAIEDGLADLVSGDDFHLGLLLTTKDGKAVLFTFIGDTMMHQEFDDLVEDMVGDASDAALKVWAEVFTKAAADCNRILDENREVS